MDLDTVFVGSTDGNLRIVYKQMETYIRIDKIRHLKMTNHKVIFCKA